MVGTDSEGTRIVLVDGTGHLRDRLADELSAAGYAVTVVDSAEQCLRLVERGGVDGILSEYALANLDGLRLLRSVRISRPTVPFLLFPSDGSEALAGEALAAGASGYVPREADAATAIARLRDCLDRQQPKTDDERQHRYRHLITISPAPINVFDETGESIWGNDAVLELLGLERRDELIGRSIFEFIHPDDRAVARRELETVIERKESVGPTRMKLLRPDGEVRHILVSTAVGEFLGMDVGQAVVVDITEQHERNRQLEVLDHWLRHNIRNDMNVISGLAENVQQDRVDDVKAAARQIREYAEHLVEQADAERTLIELLTTPPEPESIDITSVVERRVRASRERHPAADIELTRADDVEVRAVPELADAVGELIDNAIRHNDASTPTVRIEVVHDGAQGHVRIADNGPGIPATERDALLLDREIDQLTHGSGLGLVVVYWVVRLSGGEIAFTENEPRGCSITLTLPTAADG